jgi:hypothetical protein
VTRLPSGVALLALGLAVGLSGCRSDVIATGGDDTPPVTLVVSEVWVASQGSGGSGGDAAQARVAGLQESIERLREETGTGWTGRQDDVTGYLADLSGGSWPGAPTEFIDAYGAGLFGIDSSVLRPGDPDTQTVPGHTSVRATQAVGAVPVLDGHLVFINRDTPGTLAGRLTSVHGRVFPGLAVSTQPELGPKAAKRLAVQASGGLVDGRPTLVVVPTGDGILAWAVTVVAKGAPGNGTSQGPVGTYYIDARTGDVVSVRPASVGVDGAAAEPDPNTVGITGVDPVGNQVTGQGLRVPEGVAMTDTTTPAWDQASGRGGLSTYDASAIKDDSQLPGALIVGPDAQVRDADAIGAHVYSRAVLDFYESLGRNSWDDQGSSVVSSVNYGPSDYCNAFFNGDQMVYGNPCVRGQTQYSTTYVEIDVAGHEITHGVTASSADLIYSGQSGALNESFSDYFGNVIGNRFEDTDSVAFAEDSCSSFTEENYRCHRNPDGTLSSRYMLNGNDYEDYLRVLDPGLRWYALDLDEQDWGGVHINSAVWNNALWSIRTQLAKIDNLPGNDSPLAQAFDRVVYAALTSRLGPTANFFDARDAVEQVIVDSSLDPVVLRVAREVFDANKLCADCSDTAPRPGEIVSAAPQTQLHPVISGDRVAWLEVSGSGFGQLSSVRIGGADASQGAGADLMEIAFAGQALLSLDGTGRVMRTDETGTQALTRVPDPWRTLAGGFSGSDAGAAWAVSTQQGEELTFADPTGALTVTALPVTGGDTVSGVGTGGGHVAIGTEAGKVFGWRPGTEPVQLGTMSGAVITLASYAGNVLAIDDAGRARLFRDDGQAYTVSSNATLFGAAVSADYAVWAEARGPITAGVLPEGRGFPETDLFVLSLATGRIYDLLATDAQQGFPALSGRRVVWQDAALGGNDIMTAVLPEGL